MGPLQVRFYKTHSYRCFTISSITSSWFDTAQKTIKIRTYPYPLSLMSNSTKAGEEETRCGLKVRGDVIDTRLMIWWGGTAEPTEDSLWVADCNKLKVRFSVFTGDPDEASASVLWPVLENTGHNQNPMCDLLCLCLKDQIKTQEDWI